jgi:nitroimidazol reductase NimA-like FMN-containing flavoprotein (pyridoxamine 5'-phosphate oxidase superfamily)
MPSEAKLSEAELKSKIIEIIDENEVMTVATLRPDGWPQATIVGYVRDDLTLYFAVARASQKFQNIQREPRISIALGHHAPDRLRGLSMAAHAVEVTDLDEIKRLNDIMRRRYAGQTRLSPRKASTAVLRAQPIVMSIIDLAEGPGEPELARVEGRSLLRTIHNDALDSPARHPSSPSGADVRRQEAVSVRYLGRDADVYRPGAPF